MSVFSVEFCLFVILVMALLVLLSSLIRVHCLLEEMTPFIFDLPRNALARVAHQRKQGSVFLLIWI